MKRGTRATSMSSCRTTSESSKNRLSRRLISPILLNRKMIAIRGILRVQSRALQSKNVWFSNVHRNAQLRLKCQKMIILSKKKNKGSHQIRTTWWIVVSCRARWTHWIESLTFQLFTLLKKTMALLILMLPLWTTNRKTLQCKSSSFNKNYTI